MCRPAHVEVRGQFCGSSFWLSTVQDPRIELWSVRLDCGPFICWVISVATAFFSLLFISKKVNLDSRWLALTGLALWTMNEAKTIRSIVGQWGIHGVGQVTFSISVKALIWIVLSCLSTVLSWSPQSAKGKDLGSGNKEDSERPTGPAVFHYTVSFLHRK